MSITIKDAINLMKNIAPEEYEFKEEYDNIGLIIGNENRFVTGVMCCLDCTESVIDEALGNKCNLIISHHPIIYNPVTKINSTTAEGRKLLRIMENKIAVYSAHTNLDFVRDGINDFLASVLSLLDITSLHEYCGDGAGFGRVGYFFDRMSLDQIKQEVSTVLHDKFVRIIGGEGYARRVAIICGGGGGDTKYIDWAIEAKAECLITADVKHHVAVYAMENNLPIIEPQHFTMEHAYISRLVQLIKLESASKQYDLKILQATCEQGLRR